MKTIKFAVFSVFLLVFLYLVFVGWTLSPYGFISEHTGFFPILAWPLTYSNYDPGSFRETDILYAFRLSHLDRNRAEKYLQDKPDWNLLPLSTEASEARQITTKPDDPYVQKVLAARHGFWYWDQYRHLYVYDMDSGEIIFLISTKV